MKLTCKVCTQEFETDAKESAIPVAYAGTITASEKSYAQAIIGDICPACRVKEKLTK